MDNFELFAGTLMLKDCPLAEIRKGYLCNIQDRARMPLYLARTENIREWLAKRAIDAHRTNSRLLKKVLRLAERDDLNTALAANAATITDNYWIRPEGSSLTWQDVKFKENYFSELALHGNLSAFSQKPSRTPELTNIGSFEKCWRLEDGKWWLYKRATENELFSELFVYQLGKALGFPMAHYEAADGDIRTLDFTHAGEFSFEPAFAWMNDEEDYALNYQALRRQNISLADQYLQIILLDTYCMNVDRHTENYGILRNPETGVTISMAPNYDNNIALICDGYHDKPRTYDLLGRLLCDLEEETNAFADYATRHPLPVVTPALIDQCIDLVRLPVRRDYIRQFVMAGYEQTPVFELAQKQSIHSLCTEATAQAAALNAARDESASDKAAAHTIDAE